MSAVPVGAAPACDGRPIGPADFGVERFSVAAVLDRRAEQYPDRVMMSIDGVDVTFDQMRRRSCAAALALRELGVGPGDGVALFAATSPEWVYFWLGAGRIGAVAAAVNTANKGDFLLHALRLSGAKVVVSDADRQSRVAEVADQLPAMASIVLQRNSLDSGAAAVAEHVGRRRRHRIAVLHVRHDRAVESRRDDVALPVHDGCHRRGGLGVQSRRSAVDGDAAVPSQRRARGARADAGRWNNGIGVGAFIPLRCGTRCGPAGPWASSAPARWSRCSWSQPPDPRDAQLPLRFISAAPIAAGVYRDIEKRYDCRIVTMYGMTEAFPIAVKAVAEDGVPGTSGRPNPNFDVHIVDSDGAPLPDGAVGEIACRPRYPHVMSEGYLDASGQGLVPHPEWFRTGDLGVLDGDQNLTYVDRVKDSLRRRGENVSSVEVETVVTRHPAVLEAAVVGVPSDLGEDDILLFVTVQPGCALDYAELLDFCGARMPYFSVPRYVEIVSELPKTVIGRIRKDVLRAQGVGTAAWDRETHGYIVSR